MEAYGEAAIPFMRDRRGAELLELDVALRQTHYRNDQPGALRVLQQRHDHLRRRSLEHDRCDDLQVQRHVRSDRVAPLPRDAVARHSCAELLRAVRANRERRLRGQVNPWTGATDLPLVANTGNVDVKEETGDTETFGIVFSPNWSWGEGFRLSLDYWTIEIHDAIARVGTSRERASSTSASSATRCFAPSSTATGRAA